jgi:prepilin-type N-terminal cleavage/methylation domain-containing protein
MSHHSSSSEVQRHSGFSLLELMIVLAIIGVLSAMLVPSLRQHMQTAHIARTIADLHCIGDAFSNYAARNPENQFPGPMNSYADVAAFGSANGCWMPNPGEPGFDTNYPPWLVTPGHWCVVPPGILIPCPPVAYPQSTPPGTPPATTSVATLLAVTVRDVPSTVPGSVVVWMSERGVHPYTQAGYQQMVANLPQSFPQ